MATKKVLITGANSYIGTSFENYAKEHYSDNFIIDTIDMKDGSWKDYDFSKYDTIFHVAGIAHADVGNVSEERKQLYYKVNTDLAIDVAQKAKIEKVKQFIFMSSMIVYSSYKGEITRSTIPKAENFYGDSKLQADNKLQQLSDDNFKVVILRPPMIYGKGCKGNYPKLSKLAVKIPFFPNVKNKRSMLHIDNLCNFIKLMIDNEENGIFFPQNSEYTQTSYMVKNIANFHNHKLILIPFWGMSLFCKIPGKLGQIIYKVFGDSYYDMSMSEYKIDYRVNTFLESIEKTEGDC